MSGFTFEKKLPHQEVGINAVMSLFVGAEPLIAADTTTRLLANPELQISDPQYYANIKAVQDYNGIEHTKAHYDCSNIIDISMETGTGKTYTYAKTMYDLNKAFGLNKFIVIVPTLSIKAGTVNFLKSDALKEHFRDDYEREIKTYVVESNKGSKKTKAYMPQSIHDFVNANSVSKKYIHVLIINSGMINSPSLQENKYDTGLFNNLFDCPVDALKAVKPIIIVDEPHKFPTRDDAKTWKNIERIEAQYIIRYGATFNDDYKNLVYRLTAVDAFNDDLVKGINAYIEDVVGDDTANLKLKRVDGKEAIFELNENGNKTSYSLAKGDSLAKAHSAIQDLFVDGMNKTSVLLSNGILLKKDESINPYSYAQTLEDNMMRKAIKEHFKLERDLLTQKPRIKPLTLFFIDDIEGYRDGNDLSGSLKTKFEEWVVAEAKEYLKVETDPFYKDYLEKTIKDVSVVHGGYFSKDNSDKDDKIEKEIIEILHDKELLLSLDNPRRFIFSKWTLREGWDNPNVFQICKLRSSGSTTSKLQEVGRGLRLPVNEYMARVKDRTFSLNYYVDFTEKNFVEELINDVNKSSFKETIPVKLTQEILDKIKSNYPDQDELDIMIELRTNGVIDGNKIFINEGYSILKDTYPKAFPAGVKRDKIKIADGAKKRTSMRVGKYQELKELWELINHKAVLEYKITDEEQFFDLFKQYLNIESGSFKKTGIRTRVEQLYIHNEIAMSRNVYKEDDDFAKFSTMSYREFLERLSQLAFIKISTLHKAFIEIKDLVDITDYLNIQTIRKIKSGFSSFLLNNAFTQFQLGYNVISNTIHPSKFTNERGEALPDVLSSDLGVHSDDTAPPHDSYLFEDVFYDSELEKDNIIEEIESVTVFTKIPKNSIKIPVAGGFTYSPDFAYVVKTKDNQILNFVVETKNVDRKDSLREEEKRKIKHAEVLFNKISEKVKVNFKTQFEDDLVYDLIKQHI
jgi:type III restriction enzyme